MRRPFIYLNSDTNDKLSSYKSLTPSVLFSNTIDYNQNYDIQNISSLKHFKITVDPVNSGENHLFSLDTFDLYHGMDHIAIPPAQITEVNFNKMVGQGKGAPIRGTPLRFQKVHFRGQKGISSEINEYYAVFLVSDPVKINKIGLGGGYTDQSCSPYGESTIVQDIDAEQIETKEELGWSTDDFSKRIIISDALESQLKNVFTDLNCLSCGGETKESLEQCFNGLNLIGSTKETNIPIKIDPKKICEFCFESGSGTHAPSPCYSSGANPPSSFITDINSDGSDIIFTRATCNGSLWTTSTQRITLNFKHSCEDILDCIPCDPCASGSHKSSKTSSHSSKSKSSHSSSMSSSRSRSSSSLSSSSSSSVSSSSSSSISSSSSNSSSISSNCQNFTVQYIENYNK